MTKNTRISLVDRVSQVRSRLSLGTADGAIYESGSRLTDLKRSLASLEGTQDKELLRYFPVAAIAILESHFRSSVAMIVDQGGDYFARGLAAVSDKIKAVDVIPSIHKNNVTVGEIVAYSLPFSSLGHLEDAYTTLLGERFKQLAAVAQDPYLSRDQVPGKHLISNDIPSLWADLHQAFQDRHILAHESATKFQMTYEKASSAVASVSMVIDLTEAVMWATVFKDEPLTQYEMNVAAWTKYRLIRSSLAKAILKKRQEDNTEQRAKFRKLHFSWRKWASDWCAYAADRYWGGSIKPFIHASEMYEVYKDRVRQVAGVTGV